MPRKLINVFDLTWTSNLAYAVGLIASDGNLSRTTANISFSSKDIEMMDLFQKSIGINKTPGRHTRGGEKIKKYYYLNFKSRQFHDFLNSIGIEPAKSKTIKSVLLPDEYFADFLRGLIDGDGSFWTFWDKRWKNSFGYNLCVSTASYKFATWLKKRVSTLFGVKGFIVKGAGVYSIRYVKGDSRILFDRMYCHPNLLYLPRKYHKIRVALDFDDKLRQNTTTRAVVAQG